MMALVSRYDDRAAARSVPGLPRRRRRARRSPASRSAWNRSARLATVRPIMPRPRTTDTPKRQQPAVRLGEVGERQAQEQAHQEADEEAQHGRDELAGGHRPDRVREPLGGLHGEVRQDRVADDEPRRDPGRQQQAPLDGGLQEPAGGAAEPCEGDREDDPETAADQPDEPHHDGRTVAEAEYRLPLPRGTGTGQECPFQRLPERADGGHAQAIDALAGRPRRPARSPPGSPAERPRAAVARGHGPDAARPAARPRHRR